MNPSDICIGVTTGLRPQSEKRRHAEVYVAQRYFNAVTDTGAFAVGLVCTPGRNEAGPLLERVDGLLLIGGDDIPPEYYGAAPHPKECHVPRERVDFELALVCEALRRERPILGLCYGCQLLAVAGGGTLIQHLAPDGKAPIVHAPQGEGVAAAHEVVVSGERLRQVLGEERGEVPSSHHQAVKDVPPGYVVTARAPDGIIEAIEHQDHSFVLGVQWHPELAREAPWTRRLFQAFVAACAS